MSGTTGHDLRGLSSRVDSDLLYTYDATEEQLRGAPSFSRDRDYHWSDRRREQELHDYWGTPYYWGT